MARWKVKQWCATLEKCQKGNLHVHVYVQFKSTTVNTSVRIFRFEGLHTRAGPNDLLGEGVCRKKAQQSMDRGFFYVWAEKTSSVYDDQGRPCTAGNYAPAWTDEVRTYAVLGKWLDSLFRSRKISLDVYEKYIYLARDGVVFRIKNVEAIREEEARVARQRTFAERTKRIRMNAELYKSYPPVPAASMWLSKYAVDWLRYPILVVIGPSFSGKTEWAKSLFTCPLECKIGGRRLVPARVRRSSGSDRASARSALPPLRFYGFLWFSYVFVWFP